MSDDAGVMLRPGDLRRTGGAAFAVEPDAEARAALARELGIRGLRSLRLRGRAEPSGRDDWRLVAHLGATVVQECVVTLDPVVTRIEEEVERLYVADLPAPPEPEAEMPDDAVEPLPAAIDLMAVAREALALALPAYPRAPGAELEQARFAADGVEPMSDEAARPFAGLAALRDRMGGGE